MATDSTFSDLAEFHRFVAEKLAADKTLTPEECLDIWRADHPTPDELADSVRHIRRALDGMEAGDSGRPAHEVLEDVRSNYGG